MNSWKTRKSQFKKYLDFCEIVNEDALPASDFLISLYVAFLARSLKFHSILNYVSAVKFLHNMFGYSVEWRESFVVTSTLKGYKRILGSEVNRKVPITYEMLKAIIGQCNPATESGYIACILTGFYTFLRKANLCPKSETSFDPCFTLSRESVRFDDLGAVVTVKGSKVIQFRERTLEIPIVYNVNDKSLCPVLALQTHFKHVKSETSSPLFLEQSGKAITYSKISTFLKSKLISCGFDHTKASMHSLRRGGASHAHKKCASLEIIQLLGDWASLAVLCYLSRPMEQKLKVAQLMVSE